MLPLATALHLDARATLDVALQGCMVDASRASIAGQLTLPGLRARILFAEATAGKRAIGSEVVLPLLAAGTCLDLPKQAAKVPGDAEVFFCFLDSRGQALSLEFSLGRCGSLPF